MATPQDHTSQEQHPDLQNQEEYEQQHQDEEHNQDNHEYDGQDYEDNLEEQEAEAQDDRDENGQEMEEQENEDEEEYPEGNQNHSQQQQQEEYETKQEQHDGALYGYENGQAQEQLEDEYKEAFQYNSQQHDEDDVEYQQGRPEEGELPSDVPQQDPLHQVLAYLQQDNSAIQAQLPQTYQENGIEYEAVEQTIIEYQPVEKKITVMVPKKKAVSSTDLQNTLVHSQIRTVPVAGIFSPPPFLASSQIKLNSVVQPQQTRAGNVLFQSQIIRSVPSFQQVNFQQPRFTPATTTSFVQPPSAQIAVSRVITQPFNLPRANVASVQPYFVRQQIPQQQFQTQIIRQAQPIVQLQQPQQVQFKQISAQSQGFSQPTQVFRPPFVIAQSPSVLQPSFVNTSQVIQAPLMQSRIVRQPFSTNTISTPTFTANPFFQSRQIILPSNQAQWQQFPTPKFQQPAQVPKPQETKVTSNETGKK